MAHPIAERALAHFDKLFPAEGEVCPMKESLHSNQFFEPNASEASDSAELNHTDNIAKSHLFTPLSEASEPEDRTSQAPFPLPLNNEKIYPLNRAAEFQRTCKALKDEIAFASENVAVVHGDSLALLRKIPNASIDLILTDPPYHSTKKQNIYGDADFAHDDEYRDWVKEYTREFCRILKPNGSLYLFCSSDMAPFLYVDMSASMNMHGIITWTKPNEPGYDGWKQKMKKTSLRRWYPHTERIIFCSPACDGNLKRSPFGLFLKDSRVKAGLSSNTLTELIGAYGKVNNGGAVSNWETGRNIPSRDQYAKICKAICDTGRVPIMPAYEDVIRAFNVDPTMPFIDAWDFMNVRQYKGKHPAEKPKDMLDHIIRTSSYEGDVVLDCFAGSGSTLLSAMAYNRRSIGIEIEDKWVDYAIGRVKKGVSQSVSSEQKKLEVASYKSFLPLFAA